MHKEVLEPKTERLFKEIDGRNIAWMKINTISSGWSRKDFIDLYFILKNYSLEELFSFFDKKYKGIKYNKLHILRSLTYFEEADKELSPVMLKEVSWEEAKKELRRKTEEFLKDIY